MDKKFFRVYPYRFTEVSPNIYEVSMKPHGCQPVKFATLDVKDESITVESDGAYPPQALRQLADCCEKAIKLLKA